MPSQVMERVAIEPLGHNQLVVSITVPAGSTACGAPPFVGFGTVMRGY